MSTFRSRAGTWIDEVSDDASTLRLHIGTEFPPVLKDPGAEFYFMSLKRGSIAWTKLN